MMLGTSMRRVLTLPNLLSALRLPLAIAVILTLENSLKYLFLGLAALTDWLDGRVTRHTKSATALGAVLDPVFDRLFVFIVFLWLYVRYALPSLTLLAFFLRDICTVTTTLTLACRDLLGRLKIQSRWSGKVVTFLQFCVLFLLVSERLQELPLLMSLLFLCSLWSVCDYFKSLRKQLRNLPV